MLYTKLKQGGGKHHTVEGKQAEDTTGYNVTRGRRLWQTYEYRFAVILVSCADGRCPMQFHNSTFAHAIVALDGNDYDHCNFEHCILVYRGGIPPRFAHCSFLQSPFRFEDAAGNTLSFMASLYHGGFKTYVEQTFKKICTDRRGRRCTPASHERAGNAVVIEIEEVGEEIVVSQEQ